MVGMTMLFAPGVPSVPRNDARRIHDLLVGMGMVTSIAIASYALFPSVGCRRVVLGWELALSFLPYVIPSFLMFVSVVSFFFQHQLCFQN